MDNETLEKQEEKKEKPLNQLLTSTLVDIYVGEENTHWPLHERLLCYYSPFFANIFYADDNDPEKQKARRNKSYGLPDEDDLPFELLVGWLYSRAIRPPTEEKDIGPLLDLYLLSEKLQMTKLSTDVTEAVREWYHSSSTYPGLRRVQYIYSNTEDDNEMREMMVGAVARLLTTGDQIPAHWASALHRNGQLAVDIIRSIQQWHIEERSIPDPRDASVGRGRSAKGGFSAVGREADSVETDATGLTSNLGVESINSDHEEMDIEKLHGAERRGETASYDSLRYFLEHTLPSHSVDEIMDTLQAEHTITSLDGQNARRRKRVTVTFAEHDLTYHLFETDADEDHSDDTAKPQSLVSSILSRPESVMLIILWLLYIGYQVGSRYANYTSREY